MEKQDCTISSYATFGTHATYKNGSLSKTTDKGKPLGAWTGTTCHAFCRSRLVVHRARGVVCVNSNERGTSSQLWTTFCDLNLPAHDRLSYPT